MIEINKKNIKHCNKCSNMLTFDDTDVKEINQVGLLNKDSFPEVTFENSPQHVEIKLIKEE